MCIYCTTNKYRKIYQNHIGEIPKEPNGRSFQVHHIDGNRNNNDPSNLIAVSIKEHYDIHYKQGDYGACFQLAKMMDLSPEEISALATKGNKKRVSNGTHPFLDSTIAIKSNQDRLSNGTHHFLDKEWQKAKAKKSVDAGTCNLLGGSIQTKNNLDRLANGTHPSQVKWTCSHCQKSGAGKGNYVRYHGDNCKMK